MVFIENTIASINIGLLQSSVSIRVFSYFLSHTNDSKIETFHSAIVYISSLLQLIN